MALDLLRFGAVSAAGMLMVRGTPESKAAVEKDYRFDTMGVLTFMVTMVALQVLATQGSEIGWTSPLTWGLGAVAMVVGVMFFRAETELAIRSSTSRSSATRCIPERRSQISC